MTLLIEERTRRRKEEKRPKWIKKEEEIKRRENKETTKQIISLYTRAKIVFNSKQKLKKLNQEYHQKARKKDLQPK